ncbi:helix-turn-helix transcriptional regulator [Klebsiella aerogenes]|uniref:helix-turn-helix domain-containing protein n=1 Tax=Klebsiella aerogenes TaxID=548 RepID=UPI0007B3E162|nr:helix-turn-helix transcriptional regulator [Klebsiella aerogenes]EKZ6404524.1 helix-turn-helix transcriptional regulator [Klebsiella aerogenes]KZQ71093.1 DNA-binding protein [Klebsiella aerogenes]HBQ0422243.1 helix-turn-helix transcriptional regulator [Klebsiella aerogenes]
MVTSFGKTLRKLRIDRGMVLKNMADILGVSSAYLSAIELGKRAIPDSLVNTVATAFGLSGQEINDLKRQAEISQPSLKVDLSDAEDQNKELMLVFARKFKDLSPEQLDKLNKMLKD